MIEPYIPEVGFCQGAHRIVGETAIVYLRAHRRTYEEGHGRDGA